MMVKVATLRGSAVLGPFGKQIKFENELEKNTGTQYFSEV